MNKTIVITGSGVSNPTAEIYGQINGFKKIMADEEDELVDTQQVEDLIEAGYSEAVRMPGKVM